MATSLIPTPAAGASGTPNTTPDESTIEGAGAALLASLTPEQRNQPLANPDEEITLEPSVAEAATDAGEPVVRETDGAEWNGDAKRWMLDGKFVTGDAPEGWTAPAKPAPKAAAKAAEPVAEPAAEAEPAAKSTKVVLPGLAEKGEEDIEVEVDDELAQRIQRLKNSGLRAKDYEARRASIDAREAQLEAYSQELEVDPIGFHLNKMPVEQQIEVARALLIEHLDVLAPEIDRLADPVERLKSVRELRDGLKTSGDRLAQQRLVSSAVKAVIRATEALVPEGTDDATAADFIADARMALARAAEAGERVTPERVAHLLAKRIALYGFDKPRKAPAMSSAPAVPAPTPTARPASDRARAVAAAAPNGSRPTPADATVAAQQARIRRTQAARAAGQRVAPAGAGAAPVQMPALPPEAETDIASVSKYLRQKGLPQTWSEGNH